MNRDETMSLLKLRRSLTDQNFDAGTLDVWADQLAHIDRGDAVVAMRRAANDGKVTWHQFHEALAAHQRGKAAPRPGSDYSDCPDCAGSGWREAERLHANGTSYSQVEPCTHRHAAPVVDTAYGIQVMHVAAETEMRRRGLTSHAIDDRLGSIPEAS